MAQIGPLLVGFFGGLFRDAFEAREDTRDAQVRRALLSIARFMRQGEIVLLVLASARNRDNVIDLQIIGLEDQIDWAFTDETDLVLPPVEAVLKLPTLLWSQLGKEKRMDSHDVSSAPVAVLLSPAESKKSFYSDVHHNGRW